MACVAAAVAVTGCVSGPVATSGWLGGVSPEYGALVGYGQTMRANPQVASVQYSRETSTSMFNSLARDNRERWMVTIGTNEVDAAVIQNIVGSIANATNLPAVDNAAASPVVSAAAAGSAASVAAGALNAVTNCVGGECSTTNCVGGNCATPQ